MSEGGREGGYQAHSMDMPRTRKMQYSSHEKGRFDGEEECPSLGTGARGS